RVRPVRPPLHHHCRNHDLESPRGDGRGFDKLNHRGRESSDVTVVVSTSSTTGLGRGFDKLNRRVGSWFRQAPPPGWVVVSTGSTTGSVEGQPSAALTTSRASA